MAAEPIPEPSGMIVPLAAGNQRLVMSESAQEAEIRASLGLHRGRRVLVGAVLVGLVVVGLSLVVPLLHDAPVVEAAPPTVVEAEPVAPKPASPPRAPGRRRARAAQGPTPVEAPRRAVEAAPVVAPPEPSRPPEPAPVVEQPVVEQPVVAEPPPAEVRSEPAVAAAEPPTPAPAAEEADGPPPAPPAEEPAWDGNGAAIARAIADAKRAAVRSCFENELKQQPKLEGTVVVELDLAPPNRVEGLRVTDDLNRPAFTRCVTSAMQSIRFSSLDEEISVRVPYVLSPERK